MKINCDDIVKEEKILSHFNSLCEYVNNSDEFIFYIIIRSFNSNFEKLKIYLKSLTKLFHIVCTETWQLGN